MRPQFWLEIVNESDQSEHLGVDGRIISQEVLKRPNPRTVRYDAAHSYRLLQCSWRLSQHNLKTSHHYYINKLRQTEL
jgi:hypothetical protein